MGSDGKVKEEPFLGIIELKTGKMTPLLALPNYRDVQMSMPTLPIGDFFLAAALKKNPSIEMILKTLGKV